MPQPHIVPFSTQPTQLSDLHFSDIYVRLDAVAVPHYRAGHGSAFNLPDTDLPEAFYEDAAELADILRDTFTSHEAALEFQGMRLRATRLETARGEVWAALRRLPDAPISLDKLGVQPHLLPILQEIGRRPGLILVCGASGQGKTTTISSLLMRYLETYGGVAFTLEDPVEYDMEGRCGQAGYCYQAEIHEEEEWGLMLKRALRWHPRFITVGEIRTPDAAAQVLRAATSGHTVLATMHAGNMEEGLEGILQLAEQEAGNHAPLLLAAGLSCIIHQTFTPTGVHMQLMATEVDNPGSALRNMIRERRIGQTRTISDQQMAKLVQTGRLF